jgi:mono/diheme cytochrome c family protein
MSSITRIFFVLIACSSTSLFAMSCSTAGTPHQRWTTARVDVPRGAQVYRRECASCHGAEGEGSRGVPEVVGPKALPTTRAGRPPFRTALELYRYVSKSMPLPAKRVGTLDQDEYWAVVELMLRAQGVDVPDAGLNQHNASGISIN